MSFLNRATILGHCGRDPEIRYTPQGVAIASLSVATTVRYKDKKTGEAQEKTEWHRVSAFERLAEVISEYVRKGSKVYIEGPLQTRKWTDKEGTDRYTTQIVATKLILLDGTKAGTHVQSDEDATAASEAAETSTADVDEDVPF